MLYDYDLLRNAQLMATKRRKKKTPVTENRLNGNGLNDWLGDAVSETSTVDDVVKVELTAEQGLAVHLMQERELRQNAVIEMNELLKALDNAQAESAVLRRALYQERLNSISKENEELRKKYELPVGNTSYTIENGKMFLVKGASSDQIDGSRG